MNNGNVNNNYFSSYQFDSLSDIFSLKLVLIFLVFAWLQTPVQWLNLQISVLLNCDEI